MASTSADVLPSGNQGNTIFTEDGISSEDNDDSSSSSSSSQVSTEENFPKIFSKKNFPKIAPVGTLSIYTAKPKALLGSIFILFNSLFFQLLTKILRAKPDNVSIQAEEQGQQVAKIKGTSTMEIGESSTRGQSSGLEKGKKIATQDARITINTDYDHTFRGHSEEDKKITKEVEELVCAVSVPPSQCFIYMTPEHVRNLHKAAYTPRVVSIGPYHYGDIRYKSMEGLKKKYCLDLILRSNNISIVEITKILMSYEGLLRDSYSRINLSSTSLFAMILIDGCFILEYMLKTCYDKDLTPNINIEHDLLLQENQIPFEILKFLLKSTVPIPEVEDGVFNKKSANEIFQGIKTHKKNFMIPTVATFSTEVPTVEPVATVSTVKTEVWNGKCVSVPEFLKRKKTNKKDNKVLAVALAQVWTDETEVWDEILVLLVREFFKGISTSKKDDEVPKASEVMHITDLIRKLYQPMKLTPEPKCTDSQVTTTTPRLHKTGAKSKYTDSRFTTTASRLHDAGVKFKTVSEKGLLDIEFKNQCLEIPTFEIDENQLSLYRNLMVLELCHYPNNAFITDYFVFMDTLIDSSDDVCLLVRNGVLFNRLGHYSETASIFNNFCGGVTSCSDTSYLMPICAQLNAYYKVPSNTWMTTFKRDYFGTPLRGASTIVAVTLLVLTFLSTIYTIKSYKS